MSLREALTANDDWQHYWVTTGRPTPPPPVRRDAMLDKWY